MSACTGEDALRPSSGTVTPMTTDPDQPTTSAAPTDEESLGKLMATTSGQIVVEAAEAVFDSGQVVSGTVSNGTVETIYVEDLRTGCSIAVLQRQETDWVSMPDCGAERMAAVRAIGPGRGRAIVIDPQSVESSGGELDSGTYRLVVAWRTTPDQQGFKDPQSYSAAFEIR